MAEEANPKIYGPLAPFLRRVRCALCERCWLDVRTGQCIYGGPYSGTQQLGADGRG